MRIGPIEIRWVGFPTPEWKTLIWADMYTKAIQSYRLTHGVCSLVRAKKAVDAYRAKIGK